MQVRFLQIVPYSYYFCKDCDCRTLDYRYRLCHDDFKGQGPFCTSPLLISFPLCYWGGVKKIKKENENNTAKGNNTWNMYVNFDHLGFICCDIYLENCCSGLQFRHNF